MAVLFPGKKSFSQIDSLNRKAMVAVFIPLYLDSAFNSSTGEYKYGKQFPKFINPGLEFYEGIQMALDSLKAEHVPMEVQIFDTRAAGKTIDQQINSPEISRAGLFIGYVNPQEEKSLANAARKKNIPFINANLPNDAGISNNPSLVILNSTLKTHCEGIYRFLQKNYPTEQVTMLRRKGVQEDRLKSYFNEFEKATAGLKLNIKYVLLEDNAPLVVENYMDSTRENILIAGSLDDNFAREIGLQLATLSKSYRSLVIGMPTWDGITDFTKKDYKGLNLLYSTPFYNAKLDKTSMGITNYFAAVMYSRPSDMVFRGYECMYRFGKLLVDKGPNLASSIGEKKYRVFTDLDIQPVLNKQTLTLDYFENKKLYFIKKADGIIKQVY
jgi:hypothetical protein